MAVLADLVLVGHGLLVGFIVFGFALILFGLAGGWAWVRRPGFRYTHLAAIGIVVLQSWLGIECPLTTLENALRIRAGEAGYDASFVQEWLYRVLYYQADGWVFTLVYTVFGAVVALVWWLAPPRPRRPDSDRLD